MLRQKEREVYYEGDSISALTQKHSIQVMSSNA